MHSPESQAHVSVPSVARRSPWRALIVWSIAVTCVSALVAVPYAVVNSLRLEHETTLVRNAVTGAFTGGRDGWSPLVELHLGSCTLGLARLVAGCTDLPDEARQALRAAKSASVGVYQRHGADLDAMRRKMANASGMIEVAGREWTRLVSVRDGAESVVVLTPAGIEDDAGLLELCVVVLADEQLVVVNVEVDPQPISELIQPHLRELRSELRDEV